MNQVRFDIDRGQDKMAKPAFRGFDDFAAPVAPIYQDILAAKRDNSDVYKSIWRFFVVFEILNLSLGVYMLISHLNNPQTFSSLWTKESEEWHKWIRIGFFATHLIVNCLICFISLVRSRGLF